MSMFGLAVLIALGLMAFVGAGTASATALCTSSPGPCYAAGSEIESSLRFGTSAELTSGGSTIATCTGSEVSSTTGNDIGEWIDGSVTKEDLTWSGCSQTTATTEGGTLYVRWTSGGNGEVKGSGFGITVMIFGVNCTYGVGEGTTLGTITGGSEAEMDIYGTITKTAGTFLCPSTAVWNAAYVVTSPHALFVAEYGGEFVRQEGRGGGSKAAPNVHGCYVAAPVNCATGNQTEEQTDLVLGGRGPALHLTRTYNSEAAAEAKEAGPWGYGWSGPYSSHLEFKESGAVTVMQENGAAATFALSGGKYVPGAWIQATLVKEGENYVFTLPTQEKLIFNSEGKLTEQKDRNGNALTLTYESGKLVAVKDAAGRQLTFGYTGAQVTAVFDPMVRLISYSYESGNLISVRLPGDATQRWKFKYDASHQLTEMTDGRGGVVKTEYEEKHRVKKQTDPMERVTKFEYGVSGGKSTTTITEPNGSTTFETFNEAGEPLEVIKAKGGLERKTTYEYNGAYGLVKATDALGHSTTLEYNAAGDLTLEKDAEGDETKWTYNGTHDVETETTPKGEKTTYKRDSRGNIEIIERPAPGETTQKATFKHALNGDLESVIDPLGRETKFEYDVYGDLKAETDPAGDKTTGTYNKNGQQLTEVSPRGNEEGAKASEFETIAERDAQGRPIKVTDPLGHETKFAYDTDGNLESSTDAAGHTTKYTYNADDERTKTEKANGTATETAYDSMGEVKSRTDGNGNTTKYEHNALEQLTETIDPLERKAKREYDAAGNLKKTEDALGRTIAYGYDPADRLKEVNYSEEATHDVTYKYDKDGNVVEMTDGTGTTTRVYDQLDRLTEVTNGAKEVVKYKYDLGNEQTELVYPNGETIKHAFDKAGRLEKVTDWLGKETTFAYNRDSQVKAMTFPAETTNVDEYAYNKADQLTEVSMKMKAEVLASMAYTRDKIGQVEKSVDTGFSEEAERKYEYDAGNRLTKSNGTLFEYDKAGNVTKISPTTYTYDKADQIATASNATFEYNKLGQRVKETPSGGSAIPYAYDQAGNLISTNSAGVENTFKYDGTGLRTTETRNTSTYHMAWDLTPGLPLLLRSGNDYYIYGPEGLPIEQITSGSATYLHHDQLGSIRVLTSSTGAVTGTYRFGPNGAVWGHTGTATSKMGFAGQLRMATEHQLIYLRARTYDPATAQFLSVDPMVGATGEPYGYAAENPVNLVDPSGLEPNDGSCPCPPCLGDGFVPQLPDVLATTHQVPGPRWQLNLGEYLPAPDWWDIGAGALQGAIFGSALGPGGAVIGAVQGAMTAYAKQLGIHLVRRVVGKNDTPWERAVEAGFVLYDLHDALPKVKIALAEGASALRSPLVGSRIIPTLEEDVVPSWITAGKQSPFRR
jgi:RHS repeat-associated protein